MIGGACLEGREQFVSNGLEICLDKQSHSEFHRTMGRLARENSFNALNKIQNLYIIQHIYDDKTLLFSGKQAVLITQEIYDDIDGIIYNFYIDNPCYSINNSLDDCVIFNQDSSASEIAKAYLNNKRIIIDRL